MWKQAQYLEMKENSVLSLQKYPFTRHSDEEKKGSRSLDQIACTFSLFAPPPNFFLHQPPLLWDLDFQIKCNIFFHMKRGHWTTEQQSSSFFSLAQLKCFWQCFCFRSGLVALFLNMFEHGDSWCTDSSFSLLPVKLSQVFESALFDSILKLAVIPAACAPFPIQVLPSSKLCI